MLSSHTIKVKRQRARDSAKSRGPHTNTHSLKAVSLAGKVSTRSRRNGKVRDQIPLEDRSRRLGGISLVQAARDGLLDVLDTFIEEGADPDQVDSDGFTGIHHASRYNRVSVLERLLQIGADVNRSSEDGTTALHWACRYKCAEAALKLTSHGADLNAGDRKGKTPLHYASTRGDECTVKILLDHTQCAVNATDENQATPLHLCAAQGNCKVCTLLLSHSADIRARDESLMTPLTVAASEGQADIVKLILQTAADSTIPLGNTPRDLLCDCNDEGSFSLHLAVQNGHLQVVEILLASGADVDCRKDTMATPLHLAATFGLVEIAKLLVHHGAEVNSKDVDQRTPVHRAAVYNKVKIIKLLQKHGADINAKDVENFMPLHCACWKGHVEAVDYLLEQGARLAETDSSLRTNLHWAAHFGHYTVLLSLLQHAGRNIIDARDKNDQTALHYAAKLGHLRILKLLLECGSKPSTKDQDDRTPLHLAALYGRANCAESLIQASNSETNDHDMDALTPLLLASAHGHHNVVRALISLGADLSSRDENKCTALMLAATKGHAATMRTLLSNNVEINSVDKNQNTALHYACASGHVDATLLLINKGADVRIQNINGFAALDMAVNNLCTDVVMAIIKHQNWRTCMDVRNSSGRTPMDQLIAKVPEAAKLVLDRCVLKSTTDDEDPDLRIALDYHFIDPGPNDPSYKKKSYFALNTMAKYQRADLLAHPLCQNLLAQKWMKYGCWIFYINALVYFGFLVSLTVYTATVESVIRSSRLDSRGCPVHFTPNHTQNQTRIGHYMKDGNISNKEKAIENEVTQALGLCIFIFNFMFMLREAAKLILQRYKYFTSIFNWLAILLVIVTAIFLAPAVTKPCRQEWRAAWIAVFTCWINFIMYLRRVNFVGIYVNMFVAVLRSLLRITLLFCFFVVAFAGSFHIIMKGVPSFATFQMAVVHVLVMTIGEINFIDQFVDKDLEPFSIDVYILLVVFTFLMPIVMMNLLVGVAVGDIDKIQKNAYVQKLSMQVGLLYDYENTMPMFLQRRLHIDRAEIQPNRILPLYIEIGRMTIGSSSSVTFIGGEDEHKDKTADAVETLTAEIRSLKQRNTAIQTSLNQLSSMVKQVAAKFDVTQENHEDDITSQPSDATTAFDTSSAQPSIGLTLSDINELPKL